jgi:hypothetical protein
MTDTRGMTAEGMSAFKMMIFILTETGGKDAALLDTIPAGRQPRDGRHLS